jgi:hypothetical protein
MRGPEVWLINKEPALQAQRFEFKSQSHWEKNEKPTTQKTTGADEDVESLNPLA